MTARTEDEIIERIFGVSFRNGKIASGLAETVGGMIVVSVLLDVTVISTLPRSKVFHKNDLTSETKLSSGSEELLGCIILPALPS